MIAKESLKIKTDSLIILADVNVENDTVIIIGFTRTQNRYFVYDFFLWNVNKTRLASRGDITHIGS